MTMIGRMRETTGARKRFWFDPRFAIGLGLIVASVAGVVAIVGAADASVQVYTAREALAPGDRVHADDLALTGVRVDGADRLYLLPDDVGDEGLVITKPVGRGELVPASAVGSAAGVRQAALVIGVTGELAASVAPGSTVDVWTATRTGTGEYEPPTVVVSSATVVRLVDDSGLMVDSEAASVELLVPRSRLARLLEAIANEAAVSVVPTGLPGK
jgi:hypothetical protein